MLLNIWANSIPRGTRCTTIFHCNFNKTLRPQFNKTLNYMLNLKHVRKSYELLWIIILSWLRDLSALLDRKGLLNRDLIEYIRSSRNAAYGSWKWVQGRMAHKSYCKFRSVLLWRVYNLLLYVCTAHSTMGIGALLTAIRNNNNNDGAVSVTLIQNSWDTFIPGFRIKMA